MAGVNICGVKSSEVFAVNELIFVYTDPQILGSSHIDQDQDQDQDLSFTSPQPGLSLWSEWPQLQRSLQGCRAPLVVSTVLLHTSFFLKGINQVCLT